MLNSTLTSFKSSYYPNLLDGQKIIFDQLESKKDETSFYEKLEEDDPKYFSTLVRMPTGTGKTGVIAITSFFANISGSTLILTPWKNLCNQLQSDLDRDFWDTIKITKEDRKKYIFETSRLYPTNISKILKEIHKKRMVIIGTLSGLQAIQRDHKIYYEELSKTIKLVIVDEGHYEPAVRWGRAVKNLNRPTLIVSATPYRNDLKLFRVKKECVFHYEHFNAINDPRFPLRNVKTTKLKSTSNNFKDLVIEFLNSWKSEIKQKSPLIFPRAIICCENKLRVKEALEIVHKEKITCRAFHERIEDEDFKNKPALKKLFVKIVPDAKKSNEEIWIHQNKLTEGLDDPRFCSILLTYPFTNDRKLVQQIGRVLRHSEKLKPDFAKEEQFASIFHCSDYNFSEVWDNYLNFERLTYLTTGEHYYDLVMKYLNLHPPYEYFGKKFRKRLQPFTHLDNDQDEKNDVLKVWEEEAWNTILTPPSVLILKLKKDVNMRELVDATSTGLLLRDAIILGPSKEEVPIINKDNVMMWLYASIKNSNILLTKSAYEISIESRFINKVRDYLFIGDTSGASSEDFLGLFAYSTTYFDLSKSMTEIDNIRQASLFNTQSLNTAVRRSIKQGISLEDAPYQISEKKFICQNLRAKRKGHLGERYYGLTTSRISDRLNENERRSFNLRQFVKWTNLLANDLDNEVHESHSFLTRYAEITGKPDNAVPFSLILDTFVDPSLLNTDHENISNWDDKSVQWKLIAESQDEEDKIIELNNTVFEISSNDDEIWPFQFSISYQEESDNEPIITQILIKYDPEKGYFHFKKGKSTSFQILYKNDEVSVEHFLNTHHERWAIILKTPSLAAHNKRFFKLDYSKAEEKFTSYFNAIKGLESVAYEKHPSKLKGKIKNALQKWPEDGVFHVTLKEIATKEKFGDNIEWLYCDDLNREIADFIAVL